jgi:hypothetical protein
MTKEFTPERRLVSPVEIRESNGGNGHMITGYAAVFNSTSEDLGGFKETIRYGAFSRVLREKQDTVALLNHNPSLLLARTTSGTMRLSQDTTGLHFEIDLPDTSTGNSVYTLVKRGDLHQCSFGFTVGQEGQEWKGDLRILTDIDRLLDCSVVTRPAYSATSVQAARDMCWPNGIPAELRGKVNGEWPCGVYVISTWPKDSELAWDYATLRLRLAQLQGA